MKKTKKLTLSALFLALGLVFPFLTMQIPEIGKMLLPMHIPVMLCGFVCGPLFGLIIGFITPLLRSLIFGMPIMLPTAITMAFELATYGFIVGLIFKLLKHKNWATYVSLLIAMVIGRIVMGIANFAVYSLFLEKNYTWELFVAGAFIEALPGIILQILIIPPIIMLLQKIKVLNR